MPNAMNDFDFVYERVFGHMFRDLDSFKSLIMDGYSFVFLSKNVWDLTIQTRDMSVMRDKDGNIVAFSNFNSKGVLIMLRHGYISTDEVTDIIPAVLRDPLQYWDRHITADAKKRWCAIRFVSGHIDIHSIQPVTENKHERTIGIPSDLMDRTMFERDHRTTISYAYIGINSCGIRSVNLDSDMSRIVSAERDQIVLTIEDTPTSTSKYMHCCVNL